MKFMPVQQVKSPRSLFRSHQALPRDAPRVRTHAAIASAPLTMASAPKEFGLVAGVVAASWMVHHGFMGVKVMQARKKYKVDYPALYATTENCPDAQARKAFNCVQRGHQNSLENQPIFLALLVTAGLKHPITAATAGAIYLVGRVMYMQGYSTGDPDKRMRGSILYAGLFTLVGIVCKWGFQAATALLSK
ncbi:hypothetical protein PLESTB_001957800 [Pleodorina starrii]|uniref:Glutathione S-transferase 3, mitochondrial n=1 Tax=Pleodorina starrii TaxID=330485 RepID=A0A9W6C3X8_9CHLO|nr:hypothetical protein PLESTM_000935300 [Pleodorina starrii]GLC62905.1 hypothetical protein PLESTB_001957800 [Pleodorina starrii]GLC77195.1 hypothetical protein PLESTF_001897000 [Pleodorina starrii]